MRLSRRSDFGASLNPIALALARRSARHGDLLDLRSSSPDAADLGWPQPALAAALAGVRAAYRPEPLGDLRARQAVCDHLASGGLLSEPARTLLTGSTSEAYGLLFKLLCDPGDRVLAPRPSYPLFEGLARLEGVELVPYPLRYDGRWHVDLPALREAARRNAPRALLLVSPNNPTGSCATPEELEAIAALQLPVISDEVFGEYVLSPGLDPARSALTIGDRTLVFRLGGLSKTALLPQAKLAWTHVAGPGPQIQDVLSRLEHLADTYLSPSGFTQDALPVLLAQSATLRERARARLRDNLALLVRRCEGRPLTVLHVEAGWYAMLRLPAVQDEDGWVLGLLERTGVLTQPGYFYDVTGGPHLVVSLLTRPDVFDAGVAALVEHVDDVCG